MLVIINNLIDVNNLNNHKINGDAIENGLMTKIFSWWMTAIFVLRRWQ